MILIRMFAYIHWLREGTEQDNTQCENLVTMFSNFGQVEIGNNYSKKINATHSYEYIHTIYTLFIN